MYLETIDEKAFRSFLSNPAISVLDGNVWISTTARISTVLSASPFPMAVSIMLTPSLGTCTAPMTSP